MEPTDHRDREVTLDQRVLMDLMDQEELLGLMETKVGCRHSHYYTCMLKPRAAEQLARTEKETYFT